MVEVTRLRMRNFKSFRKAEVPLKGGFTCIAGANATGKSNICDALLFAFGVTSLKMLRASRLTDLVHHDADDNTAKVEVEVKNDGNIYEISRTIDRQGKSVVRLNGKRAGLNEVTSLLLELGIQATGHNVVVQGDVTRVIEMNAKQRRAIIDEISGIAEFESKKEEAMRKLDDVGKKIDDVNIVLKERTSFLEEMEKEREAALRYQQLQTDLKRSKASIIFGEVKRIKGELEATDSKIEAKEKELERCKEQKQEFREQESALEQQLDVITKQMIEHSEQTYMTVGKKVEEAKAGLHIAQERQQHNEQELQKKFQQLDMYKSRRSEAEQKLQGKSKLLVEKKDELKKIEQKMKIYEEQEKERIGSAKEKGKKLSEEEQKLREINEKSEIAKQQLHDEKIKEAASAREIDVLAKQGERLQEYLVKFGFTDKQEKVGKINQRIKDSIGQLAAVQENLNRIKNAHAGVRTELEKVQDSIEKASELRKEIINGLGELDEFLKSFLTEGEGKVLAQTREKIELEIAKFRKNISSLQEKLNQLEKDKYSQEGKVETMRKSATVHGIVELGELRDKKSVLSAAVAELGTEERNLTSKKEELEGEISISDNEISNIKEQITSLKEEVEGKKSEVSKHEAALQKGAQANQLLEEKKERLSTKLKNMEQKGNEIDSKREKIEQGINEINIERSKNEVRLSDLEQEMPVFEGIEPFEGKTITDLRNQVGSIEKEIEKLGAVNMKALEGFDHYKQEVDDIQEKVNKLEEEKRAVLELIDKIELKKVQIFMECFNVVNENFQKLYYSFFEGEGKLQLTDPLNPSESGLEINAHYKEDKMKSIDAMSGGEKSLTALAFLFAIQSYTPAPFYIFDEVDAALDKDNSLKLARMLNEIAKNSQFISITHNDLVIKNADQIIGVALNKQKSSVVGLKLKEKLQELAT